MTNIKQFVSAHNQINISLMFLLVIIIMAITTVLSPPAFAGEGGRYGKDDASEATINIIKVSTSIEKKTSGHIITNSGDRFVISRDTLIVGTDGKQVRYEKMLAPCQIELQYYKKNGQSVAHRIDIISVSPDANTHILSEKPI